MPFMNSLSGRECAHLPPAVLGRTTKRLGSGALAVLVSLPVLAQPSQQALDIASKYLLVDTHIDVPYRLEDEWADVTNATESGDFDFPRAQAGGLDVPFMSIYIPASLEATGGGNALANKLIDSVEAMVGRAPDRFALAYSTRDVQRNFQAGRMSLAMGMENGTPIEGDLANLQHFFDRGIRYITLAHSKANHISDSSYDEHRLWGGLSPFGKELVADMNRLGIMIDVSHLSDAAAEQAIGLSVVPVIASHSSVRRFTTDWERNMSDELIRALAAKGGVLQINFGSTFVSQVSHEYQQLLSEKRKRFMQDNGYTDSSDPAVEAFTEQYKEVLPFPFAGLEDVLVHFDHVVNLVGVEYVGIGSDYDGVGDSLPVGLKDAASYPNLIDGLLQRGYSEAQIAAIMGGNLMRVWAQVEAHALGAR